METHDLIIIGAGAMGSAAAYHAARASLKPLLLEQFEIGHKNGSSHGGSRITRYANTEAEECRAIPATFEMWRELEQESGQQLLDMTGSLFVGPTDEAFLVDSRSALKANDFEYRHLESNELASEYPQFNLPTNWVGLYQENAGRLNANACVQAMVNQALARGATLKENCAVAEIKPAIGGSTLLLANGEQLLAKRLIITAGPWAPGLLGPLLSETPEFKVTRQQVAYFPVDQEQLYRRDKFPIFVFAAKPNIYGFPILEMPGYVKIALENETLTTDPNSPREIMEDNIQDLCAAVARYFNGVSPEPVNIESCLYTETPGRKFVIERHPVFPNIAYGTGFSGRGFKFSIEVGHRLIAMLNNPD